MEKQIYNIDDFLASFSEEQVAIITQALVFVDQLEGTEIKASTGPFSKYLELFVPQGAQVVLTPAHK